MLSENSDIAIELLDNSPDAMMALAPEGTVVYWNKGSENTFGYSRYEAIGRKLCELIIPADQVEEDHRFFTKVMASDSSTCESLRHRKNGSLIHVDISTRLIRDDLGRVKYLLLSKRDITARKLVEEEFKSSELRYRRLFESAKDGILILNAQSGEIVDVNPYLLNTLGYSYEELIGKELWEIGFLDDVAAAKEAFKELLHKSYVRYEDLPLKTRAGRVIEVEVVSNVYTVGDSKVIQCNVRNVTDRKRGERALEDANGKLEAMLAELSATTQQLWQASKLATMGELSASVAHELNNPLATISLHLELLTEQLARDDPQRAPLLVIEHEVERMATLVGDLLLFSRRGHRQLSTVDLSEELKNSLDFIQYHLRSHEIDIVQDFAAGLPTVQADREQLRQVFLNLVTNASDAMPKGGTLTVTSRSAVMDGLTKVIVEFTDTGTGVQTGDLPKLWEPFFTTKPEGKGTGLGLAICRRMVEEHRGTIEIETAPGRGTTVRITLPATDENIGVAA